MIAFSLSMIVFSLSMIAFSFSMIAFSLSIANGSPLINQFTNSICSILAFLQKPIKKKVTHLIRNHSFFFETNLVCYVHFQIPCERMKWIKVLKNVNIMI